MSGLWLPGLLVLLLGLGGGYLAAKRLPKKAGKKQPDPGIRDLELQIIDLEARRRDLYRRLRGESGEELSAADRDTIEIAAARTLRDLEQTRDRLKAIGGKPAKTREKKRPDSKREKRAARQEIAEPVRLGWTRRHPLLAGVLLGGGMVAIVGVLIYWAVRDARPGERMPPAPRDASSTEQVHEGEELPLVIRAELEELSARLEADSTDVVARKERAILLLRHERFVEAFEDAEELLARDPQDIDGLYVQGVVRLTMGQDDESTRLFDQVLALYPQHVQALTWQGILYYRNGDTDSAMALWQRGIEAAGGSQPDIERLMATAREGSEAGPSKQAAIAATPEPGDDTSSATPLAPVAGAYSVRVKLAPGVSAPIGGTLFIAVRDGGGGPPIAVRRIDRPTFPLDITLSQEDSMMGQPLPESATITGRLDSDSSVATRSEGDLEAAALAKLGASTELALSGS